MNTLTPEEQIAIQNAIQIRKRDLVHRISFSTMTALELMALVDEYDNLYGFQEKLEAAAA